MAIDFDSLTMAEIIRLQDQLSQTLKRRFEKSLALAFSDIVDSTPYFARFGDEAGGALQQRHLDLLTRAVGAHGGRIVDTAGDGAFSCFPSVAEALASLIAVQRAVAEDNGERPREHQMRVRVGVHFGPVLTDGTTVTGDAVNVSARIAGSAAGGEIRISDDAFRELTDVALRVRCHPLPPVALKGVGRPVEILRLEWRDRELFPSHVVVEETGENIALPDRDVITFGRLRESDGQPANDVVLTHPNPAVQKQISRWHFELRRHADGFVLRPVSDQVTEVDGALLKKGVEVAIAVGTVVRLGRVLNLRFDSPSVFDDRSAQTQISK